jgi:hypothetical protein
MASLTVEPGIPSREPSWHIAQRRGEHPQHLFQRLDSLMPDYLLPLESLLSRAFSGADGGVNNNLQQTASEGRTQRSDQNPQPFSQVPEPNGPPWKKVQWINVDD